MVQVSEQIQIKTDEWEVWTPDGWSDFDGVLITKSRPIIQIEVDGISLTCTPEHRIMVDGSWVEAKDLDHIYVGVDDVYDLINVRAQNTYFTNGIPSHNCVVLDEFAFVDNDLEFMTSTYPVISAGTTTKIIIVSTANGIGNQFYKIWTGAMAGTNEYHPTRVDWWEVPGRDEKWKAQTIANTSPEQFEVEFGNSFVGAADTLISPGAIMSLAKVPPLMKLENDSLYVYEKPAEDHSYIMTVDVAKGRGKDYSTFTIVDISTSPYKAVARYRNNLVSPLLYPTILAKYAQAYNQALVIIEQNDNGYLVASSLLYDLEYDNVFVESRTKNGLGVEMTKKVKAIGCTNIKDLIEQKKLEVVDEETIFEMTTFVQVKNSYEASNSNHDDLMMNLVLFAWFVSTDFFTQYHEDARKLYEYLYVENKIDIEYSVPPFGIIDDGITNFDDHEESRIDAAYARFFESMRGEGSTRDPTFGELGVLSFVN